MINNYKLLKSANTNLRSGRPSKLAFCEKRYILKSVRLNIRIIALQTVNNIRERFKKILHEDTIRKKTHYHGRVARRKLRISAVNKQKHLTFASEYVNKSP